MTEPRYTMVIQWSDEDEAYITSLPEFGNCKTHGSSYEEAARHGTELLESLIEITREDGRELPRPLSFQACPELVTCPSGNSGGADDTALVDEVVRT